MAIVYAADLKPSKMEMLAQWLPEQSWFTSHPRALIRLGSFRFDDPAGEVGVETQIVGSESQIYQVPMSYRGAPLAGAEQFLMGTMEHSVLGKRWIYDATGDPVYQQELALAALTGKPQAIQERVVDGQTEVLPETAQLFSNLEAPLPVPDFEFSLPVTSDAVTSIAVGARTLQVIRRLDAAEELGNEPSLSATWTEQNRPVVLVKYL